MKLFRVFFLFFFTSNILFVINSKDDLTLFKKIYYKADTLQKRQEILDDMEKVVTEEFNDFIVNIVVDQANYNYNSTNIKDYENWVLATLKIISKLKIKEANQYLEKIYDKCKNIILKSQIILTIVQTGDVRYIEWLNNLLYKINSLHREKKFIGQEELVQGIVMGLDAFGDISSFENLLYVALPNFSDDTQKLAKKAIDKITDNPALVCNEIILNNTDFDIKLDALKYAINSNSPDKDKIYTCKMTLQKMSGVATEVYLEDKRKALLNYSVEFLGEKKVDDKEVIDMIEEKWNSENEYYSILTNIEALKKIGTEDAVEVLITKLYYFNQRKKEGFNDGFLTEEGPKIVIALINALGATKNPESLDVLHDTIGTEGYGNTIKMEALKAIDLIENKTKK